MCLTLRQSIKLLIIEYQKVHIPYEERAHFLVFKKVGWHRAPVPPVFRGPWTGSSSTYTAKNASDLMQLVDFIDWKQVCHQVASSP